MDAAKVELMRALGGLVRGLSTLFWALPAMVIIDVETARTNWLEFLGGAAIVPPILAGLALFYGLHTMRDFQKQERIWQRSLTRAELLATVNAGLAPFLFWWHRFPDSHFYTIWIIAFAFAGLFLLVVVNQVLRRLCAMLPDEPLRQETRLFTTLNTILFTAVILVLALCLVLAGLHRLPLAVWRIVAGENPRGLWLALFLNLMPLALTLAMLWRVKEVIFHSLFAVEP